MQYSELELLLLRLRQSEMIEPEIEGPNCIEDIFGPPRGYSRRPFEDEEIVNHIFGTDVLRYFI